MSRQKSDADTLKAKDDVLIGDGLTVFLPIIAALLVITIANLWYSAEAHTSQTTAMTAIDTANKN